MNPTPNTSTLSERLVRAIAATSIDWVTGLGFAGFSVHREYDDSGVILAAEPSDYTDAGGRTFGTIDLFAAALDLDAAFQPSGISRTTVKLNQHPYDDVDRLVDLVTEAANLMVPAAASVRDGGNEAAIAAAQAAGILVGTRDVMLAPDNPETLRTFGQLERWLRAERGGDGEPAEALVVAAAGSRRDHLACLAASAWHVSVDVALPRNVDGYYHAWMLVDLNHIHAAELLDHPDLELDAADVAAATRAGMNVLIYGAADPMWMYLPG